MSDDTTPNDAEALFATAPTTPVPPASAESVPPVPPIATSTAPAPESAKRPRPAQFGTIIWGFLLLALCGFVALTQFGPGVDADRYLWAFLGVIAVGVALVAVGVVAAFRR